MACSTVCLNEVRPGKPEQSSAEAAGRALAAGVSMKSGLEDRNNLDRGLRQGPCCSGLNEVRPGRPEQLENGHEPDGRDLHVSMKSGLEDRNNKPRDIVYLDIAESQ